jgi:DtxR family Mn-dependent transcriptional regulator
MKTYREENYLKAIYQLANHEKGKIVTPTEIANCLEVKPPTVLEKLAILVKKNYVTYNKFDGANLTQTGKEIALNIVRRHRIWETYLYKQLKFSWTEVHEIAEQLEHINSDKLIDRIYDVIGKPDFDPHGDPIPNKQGKLPKLNRRPLSESIKGCKCVVLGVSEHSEVFLNYLTELTIGLNDILTVEQINPYDDTFRLSNKDKDHILMSAKAAKQILVQCLKSNCDCKT